MPHNHFQAKEEILRETKEFKKNCKKAIYIVSFINLILNL